MPLRESNVTPRQPRTEKGKNQLGLGCALIGFATLLALAIAMVVGFGQPPALVLVVLVIPLFWAGLRLFKRADETAG